MPIPPASRPSGKDAGIETLRGLAIVLMVMAHVIGDSADTGLRAPEGSLLRFGFDALRPIRLPLFTALSGYVYALRPVVLPAGLGVFVRRKARRLLLPMACVGTLQYLLRAFTPGVNRGAELAHLWRVYVTGFDQFWFLQALFVLLLLVASLDVLGLLRTTRHWLLTLILAMLSLFTAAAPGWFSINGAQMLLPYFLLGLGMRRFAPLLTSRGVQGTAGVVGGGGLILLQAAWFLPPAWSPEALQLLSVGVGLSLTALLIARRRPVPALAWLGGFAFEIYLFHVIGAAAVRIVLQHGFGIGRPLWLFPVGLAAGLVFPLLVQRGLRRHAGLSLLFLGQARRS